ncbi:hypothetical protein OIY81_3707 [Cryptosporidium canis]|nr:hypothetical protein OIY81_3707 [Cryptosporidium canis]
MNSNKRRHKTNKEFAKGWPLTLDNSLLESLKRNVPAREAEFLEEVELYRAKWTGQGSSSSNLISTILQYNDRFPADSFISRLYANPQSILFLFNLIPSLLSTSGSGTPLAHRGRSEVLEFIIKFLFRSLVRHSHVVLSFNKKLDGSLVNLSMGMTHHVQTVFSGNQGLAVVMSLCTSLLVMLSSRSAGYVRNILSNTEVVSGSLSLEYDCFCKTPSRESSYLENKLVQRFPFQSNIKLGNFISCLRYLEGVASLYLLNAERPSFLTPGMRMAAEKTIMSVSVAVLEQMDKLLGLYFPQYKHEHPFGDYSLLYEDEGARLRLLDHIAPIIVQASLKWVAVSQEVSIRRFGDFNKSSHLDMSRFPNILKMVILPIKRDHVSDEISDTLLAFMESCSEHLCLSNKCSVPVSVISGNILVSSLRLSGSISRDMATFAWREEMFSAGTGANRVKILIKYLKVFSPTIVPLLLIFDLMGIPLNSDLSKLEFEDPSLMELYREWQNTCSSVFMSIALETISKVSKISRVKRLTFPAPVMITCRQDCPTGLMSANNDGICLGMDNGLEMQMDLGFDLGLHLDFEPEIPGGIMDFGSETILNPGLLFIPETLGSSESDLGFSPMSRGSTHSRVPLIMDPVQIPELGRHQHRYLHFNQQPLADFPDLSSSLGKESGHVFQKFRREIHSLICGLSLITLRGSSEQMLLSISAWGSICSSLRISSSCSHHLQSLFEDLNGARFRPLGGYLNRIRDLNKGGSAVVSTDMGDIGLIGIQRYFIWSTVEMGEYPEELYHFEGRLDSLVARFSERKSSHLKPRQDHSGDRTGRPRDQQPHNEGGRPNKVHFALLLLPDVPQGHLPAPKRLQADALRQLGTNQDEGVQPRHTQHTSQELHRKSRVHPACL